MHGKLSGEIVPAVWEKKRKSHGAAFKAVLSIVSLSGREDDAKQRQVDEILEIVSKLREDVSCLKSESCPGN